MNPRLAIVLLLYWILAKISTVFVIAATAALASINTANNTAGVVCGMVHETLPSSRRAANTSKTGRRRGPATRSHRHETARVNANRPNSNRPRGTLNPQPLPPARIPIPGGNRNSKIRQ